MSQASKDGPPTTGESPLARSVEASFRFIRWAGLVVLVAVLGSGIRVVGADEVALVIRFGRLVGETRAEQIHGPGLLFAAPYLIDRVLRVPIKKSQEVRVRELIGKERSDWVDLTRDGYALTGDRGVVQLEAVARYRVADPVAYALTIAKPKAIVHDALTAALTHVCATRTVDELLAQGKKSLVRAALANARRRVEALAVGVNIISVELAVMRPPPQTAAKFHDVQSAFIEEKTLVERARSYAQQRLIMAKAQARRRVLSAQAHGAWGRAAAQGRALAFTKLARQDAQISGLLRERLYREGMESIFRRVGARLLVPAAGGRGLRLQIPAGATLLRPRTMPQPPATPWQRVPPKGER